MDYNWLLTTIAQSSAALVAIFSGFIVLRISLLSSLKQDLFLQKQNILIDIIGSSKNREEKEKEMLEECADTVSNLLLKMRMPKNLYIGLIGIFWLIIFCIILPVYLIPKENLDSHIIYLLKFDFLVGLFLFITYIISEINSIKKVIDAIK